MKLHRCIAPAAIVAGLLALPPLAEAASTAAEHEPDRFDAGVTQALNPFDLSGRAFEVYRIPIGHSIRRLEEDPWGLRLRFPVSFGVNQITLRDFFDQPLTETLATVTLVPGVEFQLPVNRTWVLYPFVEAGAGHDLTRGEWAFIYAGGVDSLWTIPDGDYTWRIGASVEYDGSWLEGRTAEVGYSQARLGIEAIQPMPFRMFGRPTDLGLYLLQRRYFDLALETVEGERLELKNQTEVGFTFATDPVPQWWLIRVNRFGIGYRFGDGFQAVRILLGMPFGR
jgi:hypothetical protein